MVPCETLEAIVQAYSGGRPVDFVKIDVEGAEVAIVHSTNWRRLRPRVLVVEATLPWSNTLANQEWEPVLLEQGYVRAYFDGINCFYIPEEEAPALLRHFRAPVNVLDRAVHHDCEVLRTALNDRQEETTRLAAERDAFRATSSEQQKEIAGLAAERDAFRATSSEQQKEFARLAAERDAFRATSSEQQEKIARLAAERDALRMALDDQQKETGRLAAELDTTRSEANRSSATVLEAQLAPLTSKADPVVAPRRPIGRGAVRWAASAAYRFVRPVARPLAWRLRGFLIGGLSEHVRHISDRIDALSAQPDHSRFLTGGLSEQVRDSSGRIDAYHSATGEMQRLAMVMESTLLTLAMEQGSGARPGTGLVQPKCVPTQRRVALILPHGCTAEVECAPGDLSISEPLRASGGDWEPHVRRYLESVVRPDWVCLDIGANLGAHTLSLAILAHEGRVVAFEADAANFGLLSRNTDALSPPRAAIEAVYVALWDSQGTLISGGADELAGCSFVAEDGIDRAFVERRLRAVVDADAIKGTDLHMRLTEVRALPLDTWVSDNPLLRLDLVKLDVEGAEARVIRGADATLRRYRPILLVEYNPACAEAYFGQSPDALFRELESRFAAINALEPDGTLTPLADWAALQARLSAGKGWEDLVCLPESRA